MEDKMRHLNISRLFTGILVFTSIFIYTASSNGSTGLDMSFNPVLSAPGEVRGIIPLADNQILIYGTFTTVNGISRRNIAVVLADGSLDQGFQLPDDIVVDQIHAAARQNDGKVLIGGYINRYTASGIQSYIFRLNADGSLDTGFKTGSYSSTDGINGVVRAIKPDQNGKILVGGEFSSPRNNLARLNSDGTTDETFDTGTGPDGSVTHIALQSTGDVVIGGDFLNFNSALKQKVARVSANGSLHTEAFGEGISYGYVHALAVQPDNTILLGGSRDAGINGKILARYSAEGQLETGFSSAVENQLHEVTSIAASQDYIFAGGWNPVMYFSGQPTGHDASFYVLNISDGSFYSYLNFKGKPTDVNAVALRSDGSVVAGGSFIQRDDPDDEDFYAGLVRMASPYYSIDKLFRPVVGGQAEINALGVQGDGQILAGGKFYRANDNIQLGLTRLNQNGSSGTDLVPISIDVGQVNSLLIREDGRLVVAGYFRRVEGGYIVNKEEIALLEPDGTRIAGAEISGVRQMVWYPGGKIVAVYGGFPGVARLNPDMTVDSGFNPGEGISRSVQPDYEMDRLNALAVQPDGKILLAGSFSSFSEVPAENIIRLNADGSRDTTFVSPDFTVFNFRSEVFSIALHPDGRILIGGRFSTVGGIPESTVARINSDGTVDSSFQSAFADQGGTAYSVRVQTNGKILVGGDLQIFDEDGIFNSLVRLNYDGSRDRGFNVSLAGAVKTIYVNDEFILAGGAISAADGTPRQGLVRYIELTGDVNSDGVVDLEDVILVLRLLAGYPENEISVGEDINADQRLGLPEAIYLLRKVSGI